MKFLFYTFTFTLYFGNSLADQHRTCQPATSKADFHYVYTECDSSGGRWRVSVPIKSDYCVGGAPEPPIRGKDCSFVCKRGEYLNVQGDQECHKCTAGSYSLGGGILYNDWNKIPPGFSTHSESFFDDLKKNKNCSSAGWIPKGGYIASYSTECASSLTLTANLVKPGYISFEYQFTDEDTLFHFKIQNDKCQTPRSSGGGKFPRSTPKGKWSYITTPLKPGLNIFSWKTLGTVKKGSKTIAKPTLIRDISVTGVAFTSSCSPCPNGTHSAHGADSCTDCPANTYSHRGSKDCLACDPLTEYSKPGAPKCIRKKPCKTNDYFESNIPCDQNGKTQSIFQWSTPKLCNDNLPESVKLPQPSKLVDCPPCNPGMQLVNGTCHFCPKNHFSNGRQQCAPCRPSTEPQYKVKVTWWNSLPKDLNITFNCVLFNEEDSCTSTSWNRKINHISTSQSIPDDAYMFLTLKLGGFRGTEQFIEGFQSTIGTVKVVFETVCGTDNCQFNFIQRNKRDGTRIVKSWSGTHKKTSYSYNITRTSPTLFTWAFQKRSLEEKNSHRMVKLDPDHVSTNYLKIYSIEVTNTLDGGAPTCLKCPKGAKHHGCVACPHGHYIDAESNQCNPCPNNTIIQSGHEWGIESCRPCGPGLKAINYKECISDCKFTDSTGQVFNLEGLSSAYTLPGKKLFSVSGTEYFHIFNISLCGENKVQCVDNITKLAKFEDLVDQAPDLVTSHVCQATILPKNLFGTVSVKPIGIGDNLVMVTSNYSELGFDIAELHKHFPSKEVVQDVHFKYVSDLPTSACKKGRTTVITLRCDLSKADKGTFELPEGCSDGTCDGCKFHLLWRTAKACPVCSEASYKVVKGECIHGEQEIHYFKSKTCISESDELPSKKKACSVLPFSLKIIIGVCVIGGVVLVFLLFYCWKKNKKLEYRYMKLVAGKAGKHGEEGELPAAETCALDEEDEEEQFDSVQFSKDSKGAKLFSKLKNMARKGDDHFESIKLHDKDEEI